jgi:predicted Zn-dependent peptidase
LDDRNPLFRSTEIGGAFRVHLCRTRAFKTVSARLVFHADLDAESAARALVPRILGRGTRRLPSLREFQLELDRLYGATLSGDARKMGERQLVVLRAEWLQDRVAGESLTARMGALLREYLLDPAVDADGGLRRSVFRQERKNLADEARSIFDDKARYARHRLLQAMCARERYARPAIGQIEEIRALRREDAQRAWRSLVDRAPADLFLVGDLGEAAAVRWARGLGFGERKRPARLRATERKRPRRARTLVERQRVGQAKLEMGFRTPVRLGDPRYPALVLANSLFGGSPVGKLFKVVRERHSLCYSIGSAIERTKGLLLVHAGIDAAKFGSARSLILDQLEELRGGRIAPEELERARGTLVSALRALRDSAGALCDFALERAVNGVPPDLSGLLAGIGKARVPDIARAARTIALDTVYLLRD